MSEPAPPTLPFTLPLNFTPEEIAVFEHAVRARRLTPKSSPFVLIAAGMGLSILLALVLAATRSIPLEDGALIAATLFLCYWIGVWAPSLGVRRAMRDYWQDQSNLAAEMFQSVELGVASDAVELKRPDSHGVWQRRAVVDTTLEHGLLLLWLRTGNALPIPARLLNSEQQNFLENFKNGSR